MPGGGATGLLKGEAPSSLTHGRAVILAKTKVGPHRRVKGKEATINPNAPSTLHEGAKGIRVAPPVEAPHDARPLGAREIKVDTEPPAVPTERVLLTARARRDTPEAPRGVGACVAPQAPGAPDVAAKAPVEPRPPARGHALRPEPVEPRKEVGPGAKPRASKTMSLTPVPVAVVRRPPMDVIAGPAPLAPPPARAPAAALATPRIAKPTKLAVAEVPRTRRPSGPTVEVLLVAVEARTTHALAQGVKTGPPADAPPVGGPVAEPPRVARLPDVRPGRASAPAGRAPPTVPKPLIPQPPAGVPTARGPLAARAVAP